MKKIITVILLILIISLVSVSFAYIYFGPVGDSKELQVFVIPQDLDGYDVSKALVNDKFIKNEKGFAFLIDNFLKKDIVPGGYRLSQSMNAWEVFKKITGRPDLVWVTISFCPRKEQVGEILSEALNWDQEKLNIWNGLYKNTKTEYFEGVYYPDTYLLPVDETPNQIAERFINRFNEKFQPFAEEFVSQNIRWTTGLKIASLIAREAGGAEDMKLISGIIWNRLDIGMPLQIDATMQYTLGKNENGSWWGNIDLTEKKKDSPYNSYLYKGLPPTPICSPNVDAIGAVLDPQDSDCLFYLHDENKMIHCAEDYKEHLLNIKKYL